MNAASIYPLLQNYILLHFYFLSKLSLPLDKCLRLINCFSLSHLKILILQNFVKIAVETSCVKFDAFSRKIAHLFFL